MGLEIRIVKNVLHLVPDESAGKWYLRYSADGGTTWTTFLTIDYVNNSIELFPKFEDDVELIFGSDGDFKIKYNSTTDTLQILDIADNVIAEYFKA